ncbi:hypothetical protein SEA_SPOOKY_98 [Gordonia phage Spooky]|nr:hypothetical protein SEA_SPOOKY_98 [Gordonia phage Spooky]
MTGQLEFPTSSPTYCWVCTKTRAISGCGPECLEETNQ